MKKFLFLAVLLMAVPAMAVPDVNITCAPDGNNVTVSYAVTGSPHLVRAFGLDITTTGGHIVKVVALDPNYRIYPGQIVIENGAVTSYGMPCDPCDLGDNSVTIEMGSLYTMDTNYAGDDPNLGYNKKPGLSGTLLRFYVDGACSYSITQNELRGCVVMEDPDEEPNVHFPSGSVLADYGDAPDSCSVPGYPTLFVNNGASHLKIGATMGAQKDTELDGQPNANATGDDIAGVDDEDGVTNLVATAVAGSVTVTVDSNCKLNAWVDFSNNGSWADAGEQIFTNQNLVAGPNPLVFAVPAGAVKNVDLFSRWRVNKAGGLSYTGAASDGEVEDYNRPKVRCHVPNIVGMYRNDANAAIIANGFVIGNVTWVTSDTVSYRKVITQKPVYCGYPGCLTAVDMNVSDGSTCYLGMTTAQKLEWTKAGRPCCWCWPRQCHGDADGAPYTKSNYWTSTPDLTILKAAWQIPNGPVVVPGACADFDRAVYTKSNYRVSTPDLTILKRYWQISNKPDPNCSPNNRTPATCNN
jgi:hypothetical protein